MKNLLKLIYKPQLSAGWTMTELLLASAMTVVVIGAAGVGLLAILKENRIANAKSEIQHDFNRGVEFISDEVRLADIIETDITENNLKSVAPTFWTQYQSKINDGKITPILVLQANGVDEPIVYYLKDKTQETSSDKTPWLGPQIIYRWGPYLEADATEAAKGAYQQDKADVDGDGNTTEVEPPSEWGSNALFDMLLASWDTEDFDKRRCNNQDWTRVPVPDANYSNLNDASDQQIKGFFVCVKNDPLQIDDPLNQRLVELHAHASFFLGDSIKDIKLTNNAITYGINTQVFARVPSPSKGGAGSALFVQDGSYGSPILTQPAEVNIKKVVSGIEASCFGLETQVFGQDPSTKSDLFPPQVLSSSYKVNAPKNAQILIAITKGGACNAPLVDNFDGDSPGAKTVVNGTHLSDIVTSDKDLENLETLLGGKGLIENGRIKLADNQLLVFLETLPSSFNQEETDPNLDDMIVLITLNEN